MDGAGNIRFLRKPYLVSDLRDALADLLAE